MTLPNFHKLYVTEGPLGRRYWSTLILAAQTVAMHIQQDTHVITPRGLTYDRNYCKGIQDRFKDITKVMIGAHRDTWKQAASELEAEYMGKAASSAAS